MYTISSQQRSVADWLNPKKQRTLRKDKSNPLTFLDLHLKGLNPKVKPYLFQIVNFFKCCFLTLAFVFA